MSSTSHGSGASVTAIFSREPFEELRVLYLTRLRADRVQIATLSAKLARVEGDPSGLFTEIRLVAHRMRGAAGIFEFPAVALAAATLEEASLAASSCHADNSDPLVWNALEVLVDRLAQITGSSTA